MTGLTQGWQAGRHDDVQPIPRLPLSGRGIQHAVWLYHCFSLSLRDVETILAARGIVVSYETIREWGLRFGRLFANELKRRRPRPGDKWHLDEVFIHVQGKLHYLWRAVDQHGHVLDILVQKPAQCPCCQAVLPQAAARFAVCAEGDRDRQAAQLRRSQT